MDGTGEVCPEFQMVVTGFLTTNHMMHDKRNGLWNPNHTVSDKNVSYVVRKWVTRNAAQVGRLNGVRVHLPAGSLVRVDNISGVKAGPDEGRR